MTINPIEILLGFVSIIWGVILIIFFDKFAKRAVRMIGLGEDFQVVHTVFIGIMFIIFGVIILVAELASLF